MPEYVIVYSLEDDKYVERWRFDNFQDAQRVAERDGLLVVALYYQFHHAENRYDGRKTERLTH
jgi:hypothetical protein